MQLGLNQTIMAALSMMVIAALVGTRELGQQVCVALSKADAGAGLIPGASSPPSHWSRTSCCGRQTADPEGNPAGRHDAKGQEEGQMNRIYALWSHPRSMSTAMERVMRERGDLDCAHEPFMYDYYVHRAIRQMPHFDVRPDHPVSYPAIRDHLLARAAKGRFSSRTCLIM
ncbi:hypothetical protein [Gemmobacter sp. 24YEA27]|uniref:hypothetical protein n=1 Tax=Gemmobacter sp. 24YEA27 TaxID=3040672 RepID=UPI0024B39725|nr:hypothetical protein [Gemmobacter sp. 24YEA27]